MSQALFWCRLPADWTAPIMSWQKDVDATATEPVVARRPDGRMVRGIEGLEADGATTSLGNGLHIQDLIFISVFLLFLLSFSCSSSTSFSSSPPPLLSPSMTGNRQEQECSKNAQRGCQQQKQGEVDGCCTAGVDLHREGSGSSLSRQIQRQI